jgi:hypothetical protein
MLADFSVSSSNKGIQIYSSFNKSDCKYFYLRLAQGGILSFNPNEFLKDNFCSKHSWSVKYEEIYKMEPESSA